MTGLSRGYSAYMAMDAWYGNELLPNLALFWLLVLFLVLMQHHGFWECLETFFLQLDYEYNEPPYKNMGNIRVCSLEYELFLWHLQQISNLGDIAGTS